MSLQKERIGTTLTVVWEVLTNGDAVSLDGRDIRVFAIDPHKKRTEMTDLQIGGSAMDVVTCVFEGKEQEHPGIYQLECIENYNKPNQAVLDDDVIMLVPRSKQRTGGSIGLATPTIQLTTGTLWVGVKGKDGKSAYELAVADGYEGTVTEWLASLHGRDADIAAATAATNAANAAAAAANDAAEDAEDATTAANTAASAANTAASSANAGEVVRQQNETQRNTNETNRQNSEAQRQQTFQTNEAARQTAYQNAEANRNGAYQEAEQDRDEEFASKEATRDAANQAALNCAETLAALGPKIGYTWDEWEWVNGGYVNTSGGITNSTNLRYSRPVKVSRGAIIHVNGAGTQLAAIAKTNAAGSSYTMQVEMNNGTTAKDYYWTADEDCYVAISGRYNRESGNVSGDITVNPIFSTTEETSAIKNELKSFKEDSIRKSVQTNTLINGSTKNYAAGNWNISGQNGGASGWYRVTEYIQVAEGDSIVWNPNKVNTGCCLIIYGQDKTQINYFTANALERTVTMPSNAAYIRPTFSVDAFASAKIVRNGEIVWLPKDNYIGTEQKIAEIEDANGWKRIFEYYYEDFYNGGEWTAYSIQPNGDVSPSVARVSPYIKTNGAVITLPTVTFDYNEESYFLRYRVVAMQDTNRTGATMLIDRGSTTKTINTNGYKYVRISAYLYKGTAEVASSVYSILTEVPIDITISLDASVLVGDTFIPKLEERVSALEAGSSTRTDVVGIHNPIETLLKFKQISKPIYKNDGTDTNKRQLTLLQFSDIHGITANFIRIIEYYKAYQTYIDDVLHCGDAIPMNWNSTSFDYWANNVDAANILNCIGNHDTAYYTANEGFDWTRYVGLDAYNKYFAPFISGWNVIQPSDAATEGKCYYYKDYVTQGVRLVVLDCMSIEKDGDAAQVAWFESVLANAITQGLHVVGVCHYARIDTPIPCAMQNIYKRYTLTTMAVSLMNAVDAFIENGGQFVCWLSGHTHTDFFGTYTGATYGNKIATLVVDTAAATTQNKFSDISRDANTKGYDLFNIFSVDTYRKRFSVFRVGADFDSMMHHIGSISYDYENQVLLASY